MKTSHLVLALAFVLLAGCERREPPPDVAPTQLDPGDLSPRRTH